MVNQKKKATRKKTTLKQIKYFSIEIKKQIVRDIENGKCSVIEASRELNCHHQTVYNWLNKHSRYLKTNKQIVVQDKSEAYRSKQLEARIKELEALIGRQYMENALLEKVIELAGEEYGADLKKTFSKKASNGSASTRGSNTGSK